MSLDTEAEEEQTGPATPKIKINTENPQMEEITMALAGIKRHSSILGSPRVTKGLVKSSSARCLCSPTTHIGSFRCRHHRILGLGSGIMSRTGSVGSNLSLLGIKSALVAVGESKLNTCDSSCLE